MTAPSLAQQHGLSYGRRHPKRAAAIDFERLWTGAIPAHPPAADYLGTLSNWQMLGNDVAGDCVGVTWANVRRLVTSFAGAEDYPNQDEVWHIYKTQNPNFDPAGSSSTNGPGSSADGGMDIQTLLEYLTTTGGPDGAKAVAFAKVNPKVPEQVKAAIDIFGYVWTGITVLEANMTDFNEGKPWDYHSTSQVDGGHSVISGGYDGDNTGGDERFITWGKETSFTDTFWSHLVEEAWVVIWPEHFAQKSFLAGINIAILAADYNALTGKDLPIPEPVPVPAPPAPVPPTPAPPVPDTAPAAVQALHDDKRIAAWVKAKHTGENKYARDQIKALFAGYGLS